MKYLKKFESSSKGKFYTEFKSESDFQQFLKAYQYYHSGFSNEEIEKIEQLLNRSEWEFMVIQNSHVIMPTEHSRNTIVERKNIIRYDRHDNETHPPDSQVIQIGKYEDDYFVVWTRKISGKGEYFEDRKTHCFKCDELEGVLECIKDFIRG